MSKSCIRYVHICIQRTLNVDFVIEELPMGSLLASWLIKRRVEHEMAPPGILKSVKKRDRVARYIVCISCCFMPLPWSRKCGVRTGVRYSV